MSVPSGIKRMKTSLRAVVLLLSLVGALDGEDGLLTAGEVAESLKLDADLVVLSACNTAGERAERRTGEGFAGLTRAFMHAGSRGLLVSHWSVASAATRDLMIALFRQIKAGRPADAALAAAQAELRRGQPHPFFWAAFVHVGD